VQRGRGTVTPPARWTLCNGLTVLYRQDANFPLASATLFFPTGSRLEAHSEAGLSSMTVDLLMQGTRRKNARTIARILEGVGASMGTQTHEDYTELGFVVPAHELNLALEMTTEVLLEPIFPAAEIIKEKSHVLASLASRRDSIFNFAYDHFNKAIYGSHPYGRPLEGRPESVAKFRRTDFQSWHRSHLRPEGGILSLISPLSPVVMLKQLHKTVGHWYPSQAMGSRIKTAPGVKPLKSSLAREISSHFEQAYLMVGWQVPGTKDSAQIPIRVLNTILGGGMSSRLFVTLRENLGLAYEVSSFYPTRLDRSQWVLYLGLPAEKLKLASKKLNELLEELAEKGPSASELRQAKAMIRGAFLMDRQSRRRQAWYSGWWEFLGRAPQYGDEFLKLVDAVSGKSVQRLLQGIMEQPRVTVKVFPKK
jgi:zinc protease